MHTFRTRAVTAVTIAIATCLFAAPAHAHLNATGLGPVYDGILHFLTSPDDLLAVIVLSLLAGQQGAQAGRRVLLALSWAWFLGSVAGLGVTTVLDIDPLWTAITLVLLGGLVLTDIRVSLPALTAVSVLLGAAHGLINGSGAGWSGATIIALLGIALTVFVCCALVSALVTQLRAHWSRIAVRVIGSWIAAVGLLMVGWMLRAG